MLPRLCSLFAIQKSVTAMRRLVPGSSWSGRTPIDPAISSVRAPQTHAETVHRMAQACCLPFGAVFVTPLLRAASVRPRQMLSSFWLRFALHGWAVWQLNPPIVTRLECRKYLPFRDSMPSLGCCRFRHPWLDGDQRNVGWLCHITFQSLSPQRRQPRCHGGLATGAESVSIVVKKFT
jgi:hypothetical protein